jgi:hypothetical protein
MNSRIIIVCITLLLGVLSGPGALGSAEASRPPIGYTDLFFVLAGTFVGGVLVIGFQVIRANPKYGKLAIAFFGLFALFTFAVGASAFIWAAIHSRLGPPACLFLVAGFALFGAVAISRRFHRRRFGHAV